MATEEGIVTKLVDGTAWVKTKKSQACEACASRDSCNVMGGGDEMEVETINTAGADVGDLVIISFETASLLKATFLLYVFPILCMFVGAVVGQKMASSFQVNPSVLSAVGGFLFFLVSLVFIRIKANKMGRQDRYRPRVLRIKKPGKSVSS